MTISSFARVSKVTTGNSDLKKKTTTTTTTTATSTIPISQKSVRLEAITPDSRKRKAAAAAVEDDSSSPPPSSSTDGTPSGSRPALSRTTPAASSPPPKKRGGRGRPPKKTRAADPGPAKALLKRARSPSTSDSERSSVGAGALFKRLRIESSPSRGSSPATTADTFSSVAGSDDEAKDGGRDIISSSSNNNNNNNNNNSGNRGKPGQLPDDLLGLVDLHAAFLKTLTLHYVHNGVHVPADLRALCPNVARAWGKRKVTPADIRLCIGVLGASSASASASTVTTNTTTTKGNPFSLSDYGRGKICVEIDPSHGGGPAPLDERRLNGLFRDNLASLWTRHRRAAAAATATATNHDDRSDNITTTTTAAAAAAITAQFTNMLPRAPVTLCESVAKASPVLAKGQRRLEELRHGIALRRQEKEAAKVARMGPSLSSTSSSSPSPSPSPSSSSPAERQGRDEGGDKSGGGNGAGADADAAPYPPSSPPSPATPETREKEEEEEEEEEEEKKTPTTTTEGTGTGTGTGTRAKTSLLDRIRYRSLQRSLSASASSATDLSPAQLARRAALQRAPGVAAVVGMLARASGDGYGYGYGGRVSFPMPALLGKLKDSLRCGISREEGAACVRLLAAEVAPEWVRVVALAGRRGGGGGAAAAAAAVVENVVLETGREPGKSAVEARVRDILARE